MDRGRKRNNNNKKKKNNDASSSFGGARPKINESRYTEDGTYSRKVYPTFKEPNWNSEIDKTMETYEKNMKTFQIQYLKWNIERKSTISDLQKLADDLHQDQLMYNNTNLFFKELNVGSRKTRTDVNSTQDFLASLASVFTDAVGGINSIAQAVNVDTYIKKFGEIMDKDVEITKSLHAARSDCFDGYRNVEEIIRRYHSDTFGSTLNKMYETINTEDMWLELKNTKSDNVAVQVVEKMDIFFKQISRADVFKEISASVENYVDSNPAVLEACESTGKALYGVYDAYQANAKNSNAVSRIACVAANRALINRNELEIERLRRLVNDDEEDQTKLESKIRNAIEDLELEAKEMKDLYESCKSFKIQGTTMSFNYDSDEEKFW